MIWAAGKFINVCRYIDSMYNYMQCISIILYIHCYISYINTYIYIYIKHIGSITIAGWGPPGTGGAPRLTSTLVGNITECTMMGSCVAWWRQVETAGGWHLPLAKVAVVTGLFIPPDDDDCNSYTFCELCLWLNVASIDGLVKLTWDWYFGP